MGTRSGTRSRGGSRQKVLRRGSAAVAEEQRRHLIECCASFAAARFRPARPGGYRGRDLLEAEARIDAVLAKHKLK
jgi:hypothetical protein